MNIFRSDCINKNTIINFSNKNTTINFSNINLDNNKNNSQLNKFQALHELVENKLATYLDYFRKGNIDKLNNEFTKEQYNYFGLTLANTQNFMEANVVTFNYKPITFDNYRDTFHHLIDGLNISIINNNLLIKTQIDLSNANAILNDSEKLVEYYNNNYMETNTFEFLSMTSNLNPLEFKEEYRIYLERYGLPENLVFESEKLYRIILELKYDLLN